MPRNTAAAGDKDLQKSRASRFPEPATHPNPPTDQSPEKGQWLRRSCGTQLNRSLENEQKGPQARFQIIYDDPEHTVCWVQT